MAETLHRVDPSQDSQFASPWGAGERVLRVVWEFCWLIFCVWTPKPANPWRLFWLQVFGATIYGKPFVHQRARIAIPSNVILHDRACIGDRTNLYSLGPIEVRARATVAQEAYLSTGTHDFKQSALPLITGKITVDEDAFVGARAFILPGITVGAGSIVGAASVVTKDVLPGQIVAGNPARQIGVRT